MQAVDELFKLMQLMVLKHPETTEAEQREICSFRRNTLMTYLQCLDGRTSWGTLISAFKILLESNDDKLYVVYNRGLQIVFEVIICHIDIGHEYCQLVFSELSKFTCNVT